MVLHDIYLKLYKHRDCISNYVTSMSETLWKVHLPVLQ